MDIVWRGKDGIEWVIGNAEAVEYDAEKQMLRYLQDDKWRVIEGVGYLKVNRC